MAVQIDGNNGVILPNGVSVQVLVRSLANSTNTGGSLTLADRGAIVRIASNSTVPGGLFESNDVVTIYNNTVNTLAILQGAGLTLRLAGSATTGSRQLTQRGIATITFLSATEAVISGAGLS